MMSISKWNYHTEGKHKTLLCFGYVNPKHTSAIKPISQHIILKRIFFYSTVTETVADISFLHLGRREH